MELREFTLGRAILFDLWVLSEFFITNPLSFAHVFSHSVYFHLVFFVGFFVIFFSFLSESTPADGFGEE